MVATNWTIITPSRYEWERRALDFIRARFPTHDPYRAWANFEFQAADGAIYEVDLLDVHFISSLPVRQVHAYRAWVDSKLVQMVWDGD